jgi:hypothetical protein
VLHEVGALVIFQTEVSDEGVPLVTCQAEPLPKRRQFDSELVERTSGTVKQGFFACSRSTDRDAAGSPYPKADFLGGCPGLGADDL